MFRDRFLSNIRCVSFQMKPSFSRVFSDQLPGPGFGLASAHGPLGYSEFEIPAFRAALKRKKKNRKLKLPVLTKPRLASLHKETRQWPLGAVDPGRAINFG
jgi:hypothetical protein